MPQRRPLSFSSFAAVAEDVCRLRRHPHARAGRWSLPQVCHHLDRSLRNAMRPGPFPADTPEQQASTPRLREILGTGQLPPAIPAPESMVPPGDAGDAAVDALLETLAAYDAFSGELAPHRVFGRRGRDELRTLALIHCAHHLSHLVPAAGEGATAAGAAATAGSNG